ncbi:hypothetical protein FA13DRAFT_1711816 [Coprinellus micaceus]|uniref:Uncharacterized protein n=1 Tax=Coprinellus micaceus TaxID=71717 RepID=A0A4Y7T3M0_COPMI|nr:hypothetical protein FA13DRAFT_1711816 [Coprinellus micaceus]
MTVPATSKASTSPTAAIARLAHGVMDSALSSHPRTHTPSRNHKRLASTGGGRDTPYPRASELQPPAALPSPALKRRKVEEGRPETGSLGHEDARATVQGAPLPAVSPRPGALEASIEALKKRVEPLAQTAEITPSPTTRGLSIGAASHGVWDELADSSPTQQAFINGVHLQAPMEGVVTTPPIKRCGDGRPQVGYTEFLGNRGHSKEELMAVDTSASEGSSFDVSKNEVLGQQTSTMPHRWGMRDEFTVNGVGQALSVTTWAPPPGLPVAAKALQAAAADGWCPSQSKGHISFLIPGVIWGPAKNRDIHRSDSQIVGLISHREEPLPPNLAEQYSDDHPIRVDETQLIVAQFLKAMGKSPCLTQVGNALKRASKKRRQAPSLPSPVHQPSKTRITIGNSPSDSEGELVQAALFKHPLRRNHRNISLLALTPFQTEEMELVQALPFRAPLRRVAGPTDSTETECVRGVPPNPPLRVMAPPSNMDEGEIVQALSSKLHLQRFPRKAYPSPSGEGEGGLVSACSTLFRLHEPLLIASGSRIAHVPCPGHEVASGAVASSPYISPGGLMHNGKCSTNSSSSQYEAVPARSSVSRQVLIPRGDGTPTCRQQASMAQPLATFSSSSGRQAQPASLLLDLKFLGYEWRYPNSCFVDASSEVWFRSFYGGWSTSELEGLRSMIPKGAFLEFLIGHYLARGCLLDGGRQCPKMTILHELIDELKRGQLEILRYIHDVWKLVPWGAYFCSATWLVHAVRDSDPPIQVQKHFGIQHDSLLRCVKGHVTLDNNSPPPAVIHPIQPNITLMLQAKYCSKSAFTLEHYFEHYIPLDKNNKYLHKTARPLRCSREGCPHQAVVASVQISWPKILNCSIYGVSGTPPHTELLQKPQSFIISDPHDGEHIQYTLVGSVLHGEDHYTSEVIFGGAKFTYDDLVSVRNRGQGYAVVNPASEQWYNNKKPQFLTYLRTSHKTTTRRPWYDVLSDGQELERVNEETLDVVSDDDHPFDPNEDIQQAILASMDTQKAGTGPTKG